MRTRRWILLGAMIIGTAWSQEPPAQTDPAVQVRQEWLPALQARQARAQARIEAARAVLGGEGRLEEALPELPQEDWGDPKALDVYLWTLDQNGVRRASELRQLGGYSGELREELVGALTRTHELEAQDDSLRREVVYALRSFVQTAPRFSHEVMEEDRPFVIFEVTLPGEGPPAEDFGDKAWSNQRWFTVARLARRRAVDGVTPIDLDEDLALLATDSVTEVAHSTAWRLEWVLPHLDLEEQQRVVDVLSTWMKGPLTSQQATLASEWGRRLAEAQQGEVSSEELDTASSAEVDRQVERWRRWLTYPAVPALADLRDEVWSAELGIWSLQERWWDLVAEQRDLASQDLAAQAAARTKAESEARMKTLEGHPASQALAQSRAWHDEADETVQAFVKANDAFQAGWEKTLENLDKELKDAVENRDTDTANEIYRQLRDLENRIQRRLVERDEQAGELLESSTVVPPAHDASLLTQWRQESRQREDEAYQEMELQLIDDLELAWTQEAEPRETLQVERGTFVQGAVDSLRTVARDLQRVRPYVSPSQRVSDQGALVQDAVEEAQMLRIQLRNMLQHSTDTLIALPSRLLHPAALWNFITGSVTTIILLVVWITARRRREDFVRRQLMQSRWARQHRSVVVQQWLEVVQKTAGLAVDLVGLWVLRRPAYNFLSPVGILVDVVRAGLWWRLLFSLARWALTTADEQRQGVFVVSDEAIKLLKSAQRWLVTYAMTRALVMSILSELIYAQALQASAISLFRAIGVILWLVILSRWEPMLRGRMNRVSKLPGWIQRWVDSQPGRLLRPISSALYLGYLLLAAGWDLLQDTFAERTELGGLVSVADKMRFSKEARTPKPLHDLSPEQFEAIVAPPVPESFQVARDEEIGALEKELADWLEQPRRGTVMVTGDRGYGKDFFLQLAEPACTIEERGWHRLQVPQRMSYAAEAIAFLRDAFELPAEVDTMKDLVAALRELDPRVLVIDGMELAFLRRVGGLHAFQTILDVCNATSDRLFWVLVVHKPAWQFLSRLGVIVNMGGIRKTIHLHALTGAELRELILRRTEDAGVEVSFRQLENTGPFGAPPEVERERAISSFFRVVADVSGGSPAIALRIWAGSLRKADDGTFDVVLISDLAAEKLTDLDLVDLFVLMALRQHDGLDQDDICRVVNINATDISSTVQELMQRGLIARDDEDVWRVRLLQTQSVDLALRRRSVLHWME